MSLSTVDLVLFAIQSAAKLGQQARLAYVDSTRRRQIVLPLPDFFTESTAADAVSFFRSAQRGKKYVEGYTRDDGTEIAANPSLSTVLARWDNQERDDAVHGQLMDFHVQYFNLREIEEGRLSADADPVFRNADAVLATLSIQQWSRGSDPTASSLQRIAGALLEIAVDYAIADQTLFDRKTDRGKAIQGFLEGLDAISFSDTPLPQLPAQLFVITLETIKADPNLLTGDAKKQELLKAATEQISKDASARISAIRNDPALPADVKAQKLLDVQAWAQIVFRGTLNSAGRLVAEDPGKFLNIKDANRRALVANVSSSLLDFTLSGEGKLRSILTQDGCETILKAALKTVGDHPEILLKTNNQGVSKILSSLATSLAATDGLLDKDVLPEIARLVLEKSGDNLELVWPDLANDPAKNLLLLAAQTSLGILARTPAAGANWKLQFSKSDLIHVADRVIDDVLANPGWLVTQAGDLSPVLADTLEATLGVLRTKADRRLNANDAKEIIHLALSAIALRKGFAVQLPSGQPIVPAIIEVVMETVFNPAIDEAAKWALLSSDAIVGLVDAALQEFVTKQLSDPNVIALGGVLSDLVQLLTAGHPLDLEAFSVQLAARLTPIA